MSDRIFELADKLLELREEKDRLKELTKQNNEEIDRVEQELAELMRVEEIDNFKRSGRTFYPIVKTWASPQRGRREAVYDWMKENGYGDLVTETVHAQRFNSMINEMIEDDGTVPEDLERLINVTERVSIGVRKG